jgi:hypothetical protein
MSGKAQKPPTGEPWIWATRELLSSDAWRSVGINGRRFIDFLQIEHMRHGGRQNGNLKAPYAQLEAFGIGAHFVARCIREVEDLGLVDCYRGGMRVATTYALTWLPLYDGTPAANRWRAYRNPAFPPMPQSKSRNLPAKEQAGLLAKEQADEPNLPAKEQADGPENLPAKQQYPSRRSSYQGGADNSSGEGRSAGGAGGPGDGKLPIIDIPIERANGEAVMPDGDPHHEPTTRKASA